MKIISKIITFIFGRTRWFRDGVNKVSELHGIRSVEIAEDGGGAKIIFKGFLNRPKFTFPWTEKCAVFHHKPQ